MAQICPGKKKADVKGPPLMKLMEAAFYMWVYVLRGFGPTIGPSLDARGRAQLVQKKVRHEFPAMTS